MKRNPRNGRKRGGMSRDMRLNRVFTNEDLPPLGGQYRVNVTLMSRIDCDIFRLRPFQNFVTWLNACVRMEINRYGDATHALHPICFLFYFCWMNHENGEVLRFMSILSVGNWLEQKYFLWKFNQVTSMRYELSERNEEKGDCIRIRFSDRTHSQHHINLPLLSYPQKPICLQLQLTELIFAKPWKRSWISPQKIVRFPVRTRLIFFSDFAKNAWNLCLY